jgi:hypothetical protein
VLTCTFRKRTRRNEGTLDASLGIVMRDFLRLSSIIGRMKTADTRFMGEVKCEVALGKHSLVAMLLARSLDYISRERLPNRGER